jgi:hypothetical protein
MRSPKIIFTQIVVSKLYPTQTYNLLQTYTAAPPCSSPSEPAVSCVLFSENACSFLKLRAGYMPLRGDFDVEHDQVR